MIFPSVMQQQTNQARNVFTRRSPAFKVELIFGHTDGWNIQLGDVHLSFIAEIWRCERLAGYAVVPYSGHLSCLKALSETNVLIPVTRFEMVVHYNILSLFTRRVSYLNLHDNAAWYVMSRFIIQISWESKEKVKRMIVGMSRDVQCTAVTDLLTSDHPPLLWTLDYGGLTKKFLVRFSEQTHLTDNSPMQTARMTRPRASR